MSGFRGGVENDPGWMPRKLRELEEQINALRSERRAAATTVSSGAFIVTDADGTEIFRIGDMEFGDRGLVIKREDGTLAFEVRRLFVGGAQAVSIYDGTAVQSVVGTDGLFGGLRTPFFEHPFQPIAAATGSALTCGPYGFERVTTSGSFETLFVYDGKRQNPFLDLKVAYKCSDTTTSGEVRVVNLATGTALPSFLGPSWLGVIPTGSSAYALLDPVGGDVVAANAGGALSSIRLGLQVRRTAGAGTITVAIPSSIGG